ncbi:serine/threonine-protein kinase DCLK3 [Aulostomus maculatus]
MTPPQKPRYGYEAARKWRAAAPPVPLLKRAGGPPQPWPLHVHPKGQIHRTHRPPPPQLPLFHTRHAEESAERPHLVTVVRPCGQSTLRKVSVLLNRRGVVSFEQLLLDISEALGFPRWHRARVTRLYTTYAREVKGVCDFFRGDVAFLALGKARPELSSVQEALEELFPEHSHYRAEALLVWEKKLRPAPDKAAKADSGYSEGTDVSGTHSNKETHRDKNLKSQTNTHATPLVDTHDLENANVETQRTHKKDTYRKTAHLPNHLQKLHVRGGVKEPQPSLTGPFKHQEGLRDAHIPSPTLCESCLTRRAKHHGLERINPLSRRVPLPPVSRKQRGSSPSVQEEVRKLDSHINPPPPQLTSGDEEKSRPLLQLLNPLPGLGAGPQNTQGPTTFDLPSDGSPVSLSDIKRFYEIGRVVGDGNFAVVRECRRCDDGQTLAVKIVERSKLIGREHMMQNELSLLGSLCHPRIVRLFAHHHTHTHSYLVMELVSGGDLFEAISERGRFSEAEAGLMVSDVSEALHYIHCRSIVHRDVKPENLLLEQVAAGISRLKLGDFGLAMVVTEPVFTICGTPTYVAPEILSETGYGVEVDVWALGVILYILLCGFPPFRSRDRDQEELFQIIKQGQLHFLPPYWDTISEEARSLVRALLQPDPTVRMTAEQTLLNPWVKAMASLCRQGAVTHKPEKSTDAIGEEPGRTETPAHTDVAEATTDERPGHIGEMLSELRGHDEAHMRMSLGRCTDEDKPPRQLSTGRVHSVPSEATPVYQKPECTSTDSTRRHPSRRVIQDSGQNVSNTDVDRAHTAPTGSKNPKQIGPHRAPSVSPLPNSEPQTTEGQHHPSSNPAAASTQSLQQQKSLLQDTTEATARKQQAEIPDTRISQQPPD